MKIIKITTNLTEYLDEIFAISNSLEIEHFSYKEWLSNPNAILYIAEDLKIISYLLIYKTSVNEFDILSLATKSIYQKKGVATKVLNTFHSDCRAGDLVYLEVKQDNIKAIGLYKKLGYTKIGYRKNYYNDQKDAFIYKKEIYE